MALSVLLTATQSAAQGTAVEVSPYPPVRPFDRNTVDPEHESGDEINDPADVAQAAEVPEDCLAALDARGVDFEIVPPVSDHEDDACGISAPVQIRDVSPGLGVGDPILRCDMSLALVEWLQDVVVPATERLEDDVTLTGVIPGTTYNCRRRNNQPDGKLSEHAFGNAFDVMGLTFDGREPLAIGPEAEGADATLQKRIREESCEIFSTVLGPGSDPAHDNHFHFDIRQRDGDYRICQ